jgi:WD40 repeat protein
MLAATLEDFTIIIIDLDTRTVVRKFQGHKGQLTDATFSPDSRWLLTAAMDRTICTWDIPSAQLIDCFQVCINLIFVLGNEHKVKKHKKWGDLQFHENVLVQKTGKTNAWTDT